MDIGSKLKELRIKKGITQKVIADYLGIKVNSYSQYENNVRKPNIDMLNSIVKFYNVSGIGFFLDSPAADEFDYLKGLLDVYYSYITDIHDIYDDLKIYEVSNKNDEYDMDYDVLMHNLRELYYKIDEINTLIDEESDLKDISKLINEYFK